MSEQYGKRVGQALRAVHQLHSDSSRLLLDMDRAMHGWKSVYDSTVTNDIPYTTGKDRYMAEGLFRHYYQNQEMNFVVALNLCFFDSEDPTLDEPILVAAELNYDSQSTAKDTSRAWDPWNAFFIWGERPKLHDVFVVTSPESFEREVAGNAIAVPLYDVTSTDYVKGLLANICTVLLP